MAEPSTEPARALPEPGSQELAKLVSNEETQVVYAVLYETRDEPLKMQEIRDRVGGIHGQTNEQTDRRLRDLRTYFIVQAEKIPGTRNDFRYRLVGWRPDAGKQSRRGKPSPRTEAMVYATYGARCAYCGKSPQEDGVRLVMDHKIPLDLGGTNKVENLQPLCTEHNHAKQAMFGEFNQWADAIKASINLAEPHLRIGELLKACPGKEVPIDLINLVAREENRGDPTRRMRELRALGWVIDSTRRKKGRRTVSYYILREWQPWPPEGPRAAINKLEAERKRRKRQADGD
jgi:5-methylcytosine-specific restriction endonuclease McrA